MSEPQPAEGQNGGAAAQSGIGRQDEKGDAAAVDDSHQEDEPVKKVTLCGVCEKTASKYKCPRCYLPYCSVACNKIHREDHPPDPEPASKPPVEPPPPAVAEPPAESSEEDPADPRGLKYRHPFRTLQHSEQLQWLFRKYPRLPDQLLEIHAATQPPPAETSRIPAALLKGLPPKKQGWDREKGIARGKEALRKARKAEGEDGEAIREYSELVLHLIEEARARSGR